MMSESDEKIEVKIKKGKRILRKRFTDSEDDSSQEETSVMSQLEELKTLQKLRERPRGVNIISLAHGQKVSDEEDMLVNDPFKVKSGGLVNMSALKSGKVQQVDDAYDTGIGTQFSAETNKRDEDEEMMRYIEEQLSKRKGKQEAEKEGKGDESKYCSPEEAALQAVPTHLRASSKQQSEEMLSNQMLSGIPEVDLGIEAKIRNIEATEDAKLRLIRNRLNKKDGPSQFVPTNMAVNFVQHNRFNIEEPGIPKRKDKVEPEKKKPVVEKRGKDKDEKATDDYHYEKFKKQFRRF